MIIHRLFEKQIADSLDYPALVYNGKTHSYGQLNEQANQLANHLRSLGVGPEKFVGVCLDRSFELIISILAILKAGGVYVPIDPNYPDERLKIILNDTQAPLLITHSKFSARFLSYKGHQFFVDKSAKLLAKISTMNLSNLTNEHNLAYVIYTSGSTGIAKGVMIEHHSVIYMAQNQISELSVNSNSRIMQLASPSFDVSIAEIFVALLGKATLCIYPKKQYFSSDDLLDFMSRERISIAYIPVSILRNFNEIHLPYLKVLVTGGETCNEAVLDKWKKTPTIINEYGTTETTVCSTLAKYVNYTKGETRISIGKPISGTQVFILDEQLNYAPTGTVGELYIGGPGLARGYLNRPDLTSERFIKNPFSADKITRIYKTGDLVRWTLEGNLEYIGRTDFQVKIRGYRIELGEIETHLKELITVRNAIVIMREDRPSDKKLVAYVVLNTEDSIDIDTLRSHLKKNLPDYMVPSIFVFLKELPLTINGKIDRKALPMPEQVLPAQRYAAPETDVESRMLRIWSELLHLKPEQINLNSNFIMLGGDSLLALQLLSKINHEFNIELSVGSLFRYQTIKEQSDYLINNKNNLELSADIMKLNANAKGRPLFFVHPVGGSALCYSKLADRLKDKYSVYGIQSPGLKGTQALFTNIEEEAEYYVTELKHVQPKGPYALFGWSTGGLVAFEMAKQIRSIGEEVSLLCLIDTYSSECETHIEDLPINSLFKQLMTTLEGTLSYTDIMTNSVRNRLLLKYLKYAGLSSKYLIPFLPIIGIKIDKFSMSKLESELELIKHDLASLEPSQFPIKAWIETLKKNNFLPYEIENDQLVQCYEVFRNNLYISEHYSPLNYNGKIILFEASVDRHANNWQSHCELLEKVSLPGNHFNLIKKQQCVEIIAQKIIGVMNHESS